MHVENDKAVLYLSPIHRLGGNYQRQLHMLLTFPFAWLLFISFDATRAHWSPIPVWGAIIGVIVLGAWFGVPIGALFVVVLAQRAVLEERTLRAELPGYAAYMAQVKYRLLPYIW